MSNCDKPEKQSDFMRTFAETIIQNFMTEGVLKLILGLNTENVLLKRAVNQRMYSFIFPLLLQFTLTKFSLVFIR
jgi:hypothetical protein